MIGNEVSETLFGHGHPNVKATHKSTLEFTRDEELSRQGDCILVVGLDRGLADLGEAFKEKLRSPHGNLIITIEVDGLTEQIQACGSPNLTLTHDSDMVVRKSQHVDDRTLAVCSDKAANNLSRKIVEKLQNPAQRAKITLTVTDP